MSDIPLIFCRFKRGKNPLLYANDPSGLNPQYSPGKADKNASNLSRSNINAVGLNQRLNKGGDLGSEEDDVMQGVYPQMRIPASTGMQHRHK
jgi:hypothetical protein